MEKLARRQLEDKSNALGTRGTSTVSFNVGGRIYEVSRSLLEQYPDTMLARMASDMWMPVTNANADGNKKRKKNDTSDNEEKDNGGIDENKDIHKTALFIERNADRFQFCLDYMRDGGVVDLPLTVSKEALLKDLVYYGFEDIDPSKISIKGSLSMVTDSHDYISSLVQDLENKIESLKWDRELLEVVQLLLCQFEKQRSCQLRISEDELENEGLHDAVDLCFSQEERFKKHLESVGFQLISLEHVIPIHEGFGYFWFHLELL